MATEMEVEESVQRDPFIAVEEGMSLSSGKIRLKTRGQEEEDPSAAARRQKIFLPGETITDDLSFMRGHGTYVVDDKLVASVAGIAEPINRLISVRPRKTRYAGEIGDVIVGRILEVQAQQKRWKVDVNGRLHAILLLSSVNLPAGELRRKTEEDERTMRSFFVEGDLISAEVQNDFADGSLSLHTRSLKYGRLGQGLLVKASPSLIERRKTHFHNLPCGARVILGNNGFIWVSPVVADDATGGFVANNEVISNAERQAIIRVRNCVLILSRHNITIHDTTIMSCYEESLRFQLSDLLKNDIIDEVARATTKRLELESY